MLIEFESILEDSQVKMPELDDPGTFVKEVLGLKLEWFHREWLAFYLESRQSLILAPRGHGKSTICTVAYPLWRLLRDPELRILIVSNTQAQAQSFLREIKSHLESNFRVREKFGDMAGKPWSEDQVNLCLRRRAAKETNLTAMGVFGPIISRHYDIIILDDVVDEENASSPRQRDRLWNWFYKTLMPCLEPGGELRVIGTRYHFLDLYGRLAEREFKDLHRVYRAIETNRGEEKALWEEKFPLELLKEKRRDAGTAIFNSQYQNDVELMKGAMFRPEWIQYYAPSDRRLNSSAGPGLQKMIGIDLAISRKDSADYFALVVAGREKKTGNIFVLDAMRGRMSFARQVESALNFFRKHNSPKSPVIRVCVEANGYQEAFAQKLREAGLPVKSVTRVKDKISRAYQLQSRLENSEILFPRDGCELLVNELILFPQADHDDLFDALEIIVTQFKCLFPPPYPQHNMDVSPE